MRASVMARVFKATKSLHRSTLDRVYFWICNLVTCSVTPSEAHPKRTEKGLIAGDEH